MFEMLILALLPLSTAAEAAPSTSQNSTCAAWQDDFDGVQLDPALWVVDAGQAPGYKVRDHIGYYRPDHVTVRGGYLSMLLTQELGSVDGTTGVISKGALISSRMPCGYGTYEWRMRMSYTASSPDNPGHPVSGSVSAGFIYVDNAKTEIDFEFSAKDQDTVHLTDWLNPTPSRDPTEANETSTAVSPFDSTGAFHTYTFVWQPGITSFFIDGTLQATHTTNVSSAPAYFMINHWGTDSVYFGGPATPGIDRYSYVDRVSYTPLR